MNSADQHEQMKIEVIENVFWALGKRHGLTDDQIHGKISEGDPEISYEYEEMVRRGMQRAIAREREYLN